MPKREAPSLRAALRGLSVGVERTPYMGKRPPPLRTLVLTLSPAFFFMVLLLGWVSIALADSIRPLNYANCKSIVWLIDS